MSKKYIVIDSTDINKSTLFRAKDGEIITFDTESEADEFGFFNSKLAYVVAVLMYEYDEKPIKRETQK